MKKAVKKHKKEGLLPIWEVPLSFCFSNATIIFLLKTKKEIVPKLVFFMSVPIPQYLPVFSLRTHSKVRL